MPEQEKRRPTTSDEWGTHISEFAHKWEVGSAEHSAVNDYYNLQRLYGETGNEPERHRTGIIGKGSLTPEQHQDLILRRIALLEDAIDQKSGSMPGYGGAYREMETSFDNLIRAAAQEAKAKYSVEDEQRKHVKHIYNETLDFVFQDIYEKQNPNF